MLKVDRRRVVPVAKPCRGAGLSGLRAAVSIHAVGAGLVAMAQASEARRRKSGHG